MSSIKISQLPSATTPLSGAEQVPIVQNGVTKNVTVNQINMGVSIPADGEIDIGNGSGFTRATLTAGSNIAITNSAGAITISGLSTPSYMLHSFGII